MGVGLVGVEYEHGAADPAERAWLPATQSAPELALALAIALSQHHCVLKVRLLREHGLELHVRLLNCLHLASCVRNSISGSSSREGTESFISP